MFDVDLDIIWRQADDPNHQPLRERRARDPITNRFADIEDPILHAKIVAGMEVRRKELKQKARRERVLIQNDSSSGT